MTKGPVFCYMVYVNHETVHMLLHLVILKGYCYELNMLNIYVTKVLSLCLEPIKGREVKTVKCCTSICVYQSLGVNIKYSVRQKSIPPKTFCDVFT